MYKLKEIADKVYYVGVNDRQKALFENMWPLPYGVSYNSYLIVDEKTVLVDTVDVCYSDIFLKKIADALDGRPLDYLVVDHMEPDHAGSIRHRPGRCLCRGKTHQHSDRADVHHPAILDRRSRRQTLDIIGSS